MEIKQCRKKYQIGPLSIRQPTEGIFYENWEMVPEGIPTIGIRKCASDVGSSLLTFVLRNHLTLVVRDGDSSASIVPWDPSF